ncbi:MAG: hypothetical protein HC828_12025, partial [Blastochloris sp.]|nr:hypothetical protein [Blastochloris sp.]
QSAAALLARPSTPPEVIAETLNDDQPPSVAKIGQRIRQAKAQPTQPETSQNPQFAEFESKAQTAQSETSQNPQFAEFDVVDDRTRNDLRRTLEYDQDMIEELFDRWRALGVHGAAERMLIRAALLQLARQAQQLSNDLDQ